MNGFLCSILSLVKKLSQVCHLRFNSIQFILLSVDPLQGHRPHGYGNSQNILNLYNAQLFTVTYRRVKIGILVHISLTCYGFKLTQANYNIRV